MRIRVHGSAVAKVRDRNEIVRALSTKELTHVGTATQTLITGTALRRAGYAHTIAHLHSAHFRAYGLDNPDASVTLNQRHFVQSSERGRHRR
jgi:hypothetical protein